MKINDRYMAESIGTMCQLLKPTKDGGGEWLCPCGKVISIRSKEDGHIIYSEKCGIEPGED